MVADIKSNPENEPPRRGPSIKVGVSGVIALVVIAKLIHTVTSAEVEGLKAQLTADLFALENSNASPISIVRGAKSLLAKLEQTPTWEDSRHAITASYINLVKDNKDFKEYLSHQDLLERVRALIVANAVKLTQAEADAEGVGGFRRFVSQDAAQQNLDVTQRLSRTGGDIFEIARETPKPLLEETLRRGGQVKDVGVKAAQEAAPVGQQVITELDNRAITNPLLGITSVGLLVFMKNKWLAIFIIIGLVAVLKNQQIAAAKQAVVDVKDKIEKVVP